MRCIAAFIFDIASILILKRPSKALRMRGSSSMQLPVFSMLFHRHHHPLTFALAGSVGLFSSDDYALETLEVFTADPATRR